MTDIEAWIKTAAEKHCDRFAPPATLGCEGHGEPVWHFCGPCFARHVLVNYRDCPKCAIANAKPDCPACELCRGSGVVDEEGPDRPLICNRCNGSGKKT